MTLLVRDEEDIIESTLAYHLAQGVDFIIATDNGSRDGTVDILRRFESKGLLQLIHEPQDDFNQQEWVTRMARLAHTSHGAGWVINSDADEFWWPHRGDLKEFFSSVPMETGVIAVPRYNFVVEAEISGTPFHHRMTHRERASYNNVGQRLPAKAAHRGGGSVRVDQGNHEVTGAGPVRSADGSVSILHFPVRSYRQIENKISKGGAAYARNRSVPASTGGTWRRLYGDLQRDGNLRDYYHGLLHDGARLEARLELGEIVEDNRLRDFLDSRVG